MSNALAIAAVTAVLQDLLRDALMNFDQSVTGTVKVTALPPDRIAATNTDERGQINLFLYLVTPNSGWRNMDLPSRDRNGERLTNPPLALDLHYLVTTYGAEELHAEALLGCAMQALHEKPLLTREMIEQALNPDPPPGEAQRRVLKWLFPSALAEQVESLKICPQTLTTEEISKLWAATQAHYRPTAAYQVSVVLIQETKPVRSALPVLTRGPEDRGPSAQANLLPPFPTLERIDLPENQISAQMNDQITLVGHDLAGDQGDPAQVTLSVLLSNQWSEQPILINVPSQKRTDQSITFTIPHQAGAPYQAGFYRVSVQIAPKDKPEEIRDSNELALPVAPRIMAINGKVLPAPPNEPISIARTKVQNNGLGEVILQIKCSPEVELFVEKSPQKRFDLRQSALLLLGTHTIAAQEDVVSTPVQAGRTDTLTFVVKEIAAGTYRLRLRIDGVDSLLIDRSDASHPKFDESQQVILT